MRNDEIDGELVQYNPWWRDPDGWQGKDVQLRTATQSPLRYNPRPLEGLSRGGLYILRGPRRVGKSTALKQLIADRLHGGQAPRTILHVSVEGRTAQDLVDIVRRGTSTWLTGEPGDRLWVLDEVTDVDGPWPESLKRLRDSDASFSVDTVILTGSSAAKFEEARKQLAGRRNAERSDRTLFQMGFADVARALGIELPVAPGLSIAQLANADAVATAITEARPWADTLVDVWDRFLQVGGYPQAVEKELTAPGEGGGVALREALWNVIQGDAFKASGLTETQTQSVLRSITSSLSSLFSVNSMAEAVAIAHGTAEARLDALRRAFIAFPVHREQGLAPRPQSQSKWYFTDPRLARLASEHGAGSPPPASAMSEQQLAHALLIALEKESPGAAIRHNQLLYYRSRTNAEIDFVSAAFRAACVESKYVDRGWGRAFQTIEASGRKAGLVATRSGLQQHDGGWALPAGLLAFLLSD
jgi:uncharacterized protein